MNWLEQPQEERTELSKKHSLDSTSKPGEGGTPTKRGTEDMATLVRAERDRTESKERTVTCYFMAIAVLQGCVIHQVRHDLESFYWFLVWLVLRHTKHTRPSKETALSDLFDQVTVNACRIMKVGWLSVEPLGVEDNKPLTNLLSRFTEVCKMNNAGQSSVPLTYERVLDIFDEALAREDWPTDDKAIPFPPAGDAKPPRQARPKGSLSNAQTSADARRGQARAFASQANRSRMPLYQAIAHAPGLRGAVSKTAVLVLQPHFPRQHSSTITRALMLASGEGDDHAGVPAYEEHQEGSSHISIQYLAHGVSNVVMPHAASEAVVEPGSLSVLQRSRASPRVLTPEPWGTPLPLVTSQFRAALLEPDSLPLAHGEASSHARPSSSETMDVPTRGSDTGRKRSHEDLGKNEEEPGPSKRSRTHGQK
ncbi:uncharacterized protein B0H18DRAFT_89487 [Fomitopsis serialis]|uniref:uncharacterized protein n=1 Tax=Fomitopsis serialis TaxID=139415 RepID=UPI002008CA5D|nr:uncharacterized protein B0H18DRAFT_89487 [Neoantrodia serialis]KAH9915740.1 hypothetical protein B0H18DRAFT_89487 [Neoantrodia serialis]